MSRTASDWLIAFLASVSLLSACSFGPPDSPELVIDNVMIVDVARGSIEPDQSVSIADGIIVAIAPTNVGDGAPGIERIDGEGVYLIPGLWDSHVHSVESVDWHFPLFVAHGVTSVRNLHTGVQRPLETVLALKSEIATGERLGPRLLGNGSLVDGTPPLLGGASEHAIASTPEEGRAFVAAMDEGGADFIKVYGMLSRDTYFAILDEARLRDIPVDGHVPFLVHPIEAADAGQRTDEHGLGMAIGCSRGWQETRDASLEQIAREGEVSMVESFRLERELYDAHDPTACASTIEAYLRNGVAVTPTLAIYMNGDDPSKVVEDPATMALLPDDIASFWTAIANEDDEVREIMGPTGPKLAENVALFHEAGVTMLAGTDVGNPMLVPGLSLHQELAYLVDAGLSPFEALQTATINPARVFGLEDTLGTVAVGKRADLVLLERNPLEDISAVGEIRAVVLNGNLLDRAELDQFLAP